MRRASRRRRGYNPRRKPAKLVDPVGPFIRVSDFDSSLGASCGRLGAVGLVRPLGAEYGRPSAFDCG